MKSIAKTICTERDAILQTFALMVGVGVLFSLLALAIKAVTGENMDQLLPIGALVGGAIGLMVAAVIAALQLPVSLPIGVRMGRTRRQMLAGLYCVGVLEVAGALPAFALLLGLDVLLQGALDAACFANAAVVLGEMLALARQWWYLVPLGLLGLPVVCMLVGSLPLLFGRRGIYVLWGVIAFAWLLPVVILPFVDLNSTTRLAILVRPLALWLASVGPAPKIALAAVLALALVALTGWRVLRVDIKED